LKIVMEHLTTASACDMIRSCDENVVGTITAHHLSLLVDDWAGNVFHYCKPVAKLPPDRRALLDAVVNSNGKFFLGTDSARECHSPLRLGWVEKINNNLPFLW
jgi:dihydroorotase